MHYPINMVEEILQKTKGMKLEGFVEGTGPLFPKAMLIGEAPGRKEIQEKIPFCGRAGKELTSYLESIGLTRKDVYITSTIRSRPFAVKKRMFKQGQVYIQRVVYPNRVPTRKEQLIFSPLLDWEIQTYHPTIIITLGNVSLQRLLGTNINISKAHGKIFKVSIQKLSPDKKNYMLTEEKYVVIPLYHPAAVFYNSNLKETIADDWGKVNDYLKSLN